MAGARHRENAAPAISSWRRPPSITTSGCQRRMHLAPVIDALGVRLLGQLASVCQWRRRTFPSAGRRCWPHAGHSIESVGTRKSESMCAFSLMPRVSQALAARAHPRRMIAAHQYPSDERNDGYKTIVAVSTIVKPARTRRLAIGAARARLGEVRCRRQALVAIAGKRISRR
jgi:hypothetical protein